MSSDLEGESRGADDGGERPAPRALAALGLAGGMDQRLQVADRRVREEGVVVHEDAELLLDDPEQLHAAQGIEVEIARQACRRGDRGRGAGPRRWR